MRLLTMRLMRHWQGYCDEVQVFINKDNSITVIDNGRGIPVGINHKAGKPAVEVVFTVLCMPAENSAVADTKYPVVCTV